MSVKNKTQKPVEESRVIRIKLPTASAMSALAVPVSIIFSGVLIAASLISSGNTIRDGIKASGSTVGTTQQVQQQQQTVDPTTGSTNVGSMQSLGSKDAKVAIIEFSDFECPFCGRFYDQANRDIMKNYVDTNKVQVFYRHFPLEFHPEARPLAEASVCANEQGKFWNFHDQIFEKVLANGGSVPSGLATNVANEVGLDIGKYNDCLSSKRLSSIIDTDISEGTQIGVNGTPAFLIGTLNNGRIENGTIVVGAQPYSEFQRVIDSYLK